MSNIRVSDEEAHPSQRTVKAMAVHTQEAGRVGDVPTCRAVPTRDLREDVPSRRASAG